MIWHGENKWLFGGFPSVVRESPVLPMFLKCLRRRIESAATVSETKPALPLFRADSFSADRLWHVKEFKHDRSLFPLQPQKWDKLGDKPFQVVVVESENKVSSTSSSSPNVGMLLSTILSNRIEQWFAGLSNANGRLQAKSSNSFLAILAEIFMDSEFTFAVHNSSKIGKLGWC